MLNKITLFLFNLTIMSFSFTSAEARQASPYIDTSHYSMVFGRTKLYRIYLPDGYEVSGKRYPVVYFFHGWGGRHYKDDNALLEYEKIKPYETTQFTGFNENYLRGYAVEYYNNTLNKCKELATTLMREEAKKVILSKYSY